MAKQKLLRAQILQKAFERAKRANSSFSLRALARKLELSPPFVSRVLSGKIELPYERLGGFITHLKIDKISENRLLKTYADQRTLEIMNLTGGAGEKQEQIMREYEELAEKQHALLTKWHYIAILDLAGCKGFSAEPAWISRKLEMPIEEAKQAIDFLCTQKFLVCDPSGRWAKTTKDIRFPTKESRDLIRTYHELLMKKAISQLRTKKSQGDFERRLIAGHSMAANPANLEKAMARLSEAIYEVAEILGSGECTEVYHLGYQLFPLTKPE